VVLKTEDGTEALIPNDTFITSTVVRQTYANHRLRLVTTIKVSYSSPVETAMRIMLEATKRQQILAEPEPVVILREFAENGVILDLIIWVQDPEGGVLRLRSNLNREILVEFEKNGVGVK
jgi:small-conductance mechanosensitive channel